MKFRLNIVVSILLLGAILASASVLAQNHQARKDFFGGPPSTEQRLAHLSEALDLSDEQAVQMLVVLQETEARREALREETASLLGPEICALMVETESDILEILTPDQAEQFQLMKEERQARGEERRQRRGRPDPLDCSQYEGS